MRMMMVFGRVICNDSDYYDDAADDGDADDGDDGAAPYGDDDADDV